MSFLNGVYAKRQQLATALKENPGLVVILQELYPDRAHFLFELLQNAEDAGAAEVAFDLRPDKLVFEHDGNAFDEQDVWGITDIGMSSKHDQEDKVGRFGVGFKAVFAYSETPHIWSPTFCFKITDLILPTKLPSRNDLGKRTRFEFPFNNPKKSPEDAFQEVEAGIRSLAETTLLFLSSLKTIHWQIGDDVRGKVLLTQHSANHVEALRESTGTPACRSHFLKFDRPVEGLENQRVAVAFALEFRTDADTFDPTEPVAKQLRIIPASPGRVAVYFPAEKEVSGLRFHLHAPFVPALDRASIKDTPANIPLFEQLAALVAASLHRIRDLGLFTTDFLEVLPNGRDQVGEPYDAIRSAIIDEMNDEPLTPTYPRSHAPARDLVQGKLSLKRLLSAEDLDVLVEYEKVPPQWAAGVAQENSNADRFLDSLAIGKWDVDDLVEVLRNKTHPGGNAGPPDSVAPEAVQDWLRGKSVEWHQELYALLLNDHLMKARRGRDRLARTLGSLRIVRLADGGYGIGSESFFATDGLDRDEGLAFVDEGVYASGKSKSRRESARAFLEEIGVREVGEAELVEVILKRRYFGEGRFPGENTHRKDLNRFVALVEREPKAADLFRDYHIFCCEDGWRKPEEIFLDQPFLDTGLRAYYNALGERADRALLDRGYENLRVGPRRLAEFAVAVGASKSLEVQRVRCEGNPKAEELGVHAAGNFTCYGVDSDFQIEGLDELLPTSNEVLSRLIWRTLCEQTDDIWATARYRKNYDHPEREALSQLACVLRDRAWVPQSDGRFVCPMEARSDLLPSGFLFDPGWKWLTVIGFGQQSTELPEQESQRRVLTEHGFGDADTLRRAQRFTRLPVEEQRRILTEREVVELPVRVVVQRERRGERVAEEAANAPERVTEERVRRVWINREVVKKEAGAYLRHQYTNSDGHMICQVCRTRLPFQLDDGKDYFERVEFLRTLKRHHKQNYLALCPNHAAMFQHANGSTKELREGIMGLDGETLPVVLAKEETTIYFTEAHLFDLRTVIEEETGWAARVEVECADMPDPANPSDDQRS